MGSLTLKNMANVEIGSSPVVPCFPAFSVKALEKIQGQFRLINPGDIVVVDPSAPCENGNLVLVGQRLEQWCGQQGVIGVATLLWSDDV